METLKSVNGLSGGAKTSTGQTLLVPSGGEDGETDGEFEAFNMHLSPSGDSAIKYIVRKGDTLGGIARRYRVSLASLKQWNSGALKTLRVGQAISIMQASPRKSFSRLGKSGNGALKRVNAVANSGGRHDGI